MPARVPLCVWLGGGDSSFLLWRDLCPSSEPVHICRMMHFPSYLYSFPLSSVFLLYIALVLWIQ